MPTIISVDEYKKVLPGYKPQKASKYHQESAKLADKAFSDALKSDPSDQVILMCGGSASGKTEFVSEYLQQEEAIIYDGTLSNPKGAEVKLRNIIKAKKTPVVCAVIPDNLLRAFVAFLHRSRQFSDEHFYRTQSGSRKTLLWITESYPEVEIRVIESSYSESQNLKFAVLVFSNRKLMVEYVKSVQYTEQDIIRIITHQL